MQIEISQTRRTDDAKGSVADELRLAVAALLGGRHGTARMCDALVTVAAELALVEAGRGGTAAWLERVAGDVRCGRLAA